MRNNTNFMETGVLTALAVHVGVPEGRARELLSEEPSTPSRPGRRSAPFGFVIPAGQADLTRVARLVNLLRIQGIEVGRDDGRSRTVSDGTYPAGSYVIKRDQPYGRLAKILLEKQDFPDPALRTYDDTGWTMGLMLQAEVKATADKRRRCRRRSSPSTRVEPAGSLSGPPGGRDRRRQPRREQRS